RFAAIAGCLGVAFWGTGGPPAGIHLRLRRPCPPSRPRALRAADIVLGHAFISLSVFLLMFDGVALSQGRRIALVIGVSKYKNVPQLPNTANDATAAEAARR